MAKVTSNQNTNNRDLPPYLTPAAAVVLPEAGFSRTLTGVDNPVAPQAASGSQSAYATYTVTVNAQANTASGDSIVIEAPAGSSVRILKVRILQPGIQTAAGVRLLQLVRRTTAGTGGAVTPTVHDPADSAYGGICRAKPTVGTLGAVIQDIPVYVPAAVAAFVPITIDFGMLAQDKAPVIAAGTANGIALLDPGAAGGSGFAASITFAVVL